MSANPSSSPCIGLTSHDAAVRLEEFDPNDLAIRRARSPWLDFVILFTNPLAIILLLAAAISRLIGEAFNAGLIAMLVVLGTSIDFLQTYRSRKAIEHLRSKVASTASVMRDGQWCERARCDLVPGDLIRLSAGDMVLADAQLQDARDLYVQQAALTGESAPAEKMATAEPPSHSPNAYNMVFVGTSVVSGTAIAKVNATGSRTAFGEITAKLADRPPQTAFDLCLRRFSYLITRFVFVLFVLVASIASHKPALDSLLFAVSLAVGLTPEFLPMITSVTLSRGALAMARKHVIVKRLPAIQNLGSIDILYTDKLGTLTTGALVLQESIGPQGLVSNRPRRYVAVNSRLQTGIRSPLDAAILAAEAEQQEAPVKLDEIPFDFQRRRLSIVVEIGRKRILICKGSPEGIFPLLTAIERRLHFAGDRGADRKAQPALSGEECQGLPSAGGGNSGGCRTAALQCRRRV
jgi:Mg2+-importing ATPase